MIKRVHGIGLFSAERNDGRYSLPFVLVQRSAAADPPPTQEKGEAATPRHTSHLESCCE